MHSDIKLTNVLFLHENWNKVGCWKKLTVNTANKRFLSRSRRWHENSWQIKSGRHVVGFVNRSQDGNSCCTCQNLVLCPSIRGSALLSCYFRLCSTRNDFYQMNVNMDISGFRIMNNDSFFALMYSWSPPWSGKPKTLFSIWPWKEEE